MCFSQLVSDSVDNQLQTDTVYANFSKTFDMIDYSILLTKLNDFCFDINLTTFFNPI